MDRNEEALLDEQLTILIDLFPDMDMGVLLDAVVHSEGSREQAIDYVLAHQVARSIESKDEEELLSCEDNLPATLVGTVQELQNYYPELDHATLCSFVLAHEGESLEALRELLSMALRHQRRRRRRKDDIIPIEGAYFQVGNEASTVQLPVYASPSRTITGLKDAIIRSLRGEFDFDDRKDNSEVDSHELRNQASALHAERVELLRKASAAYSTHKGGPLAQYYSMEAADIGRRIQELQQRAAYHKFVELNRDLPDHTIDLHGLTVSQGLAIVNITVEYLQTLVVTTSNEEQPVRLIVGAGKHSVAGARLSPAINERLRSLQVQYSHDGAAVFTLYRPKKK